MIAENLFLRLLPPKFRVDELIQFSAIQDAFHIVRFDIRAMVYDLPIIPGDVGRSGEKSDALIADVSPPTNQSREGGEGGKTECG